MKKTVFLLAAVLCGALTIGATACGNTEGKYTVYAPDGAPALALAYAIYQKDDRFNYRIVDSALIHVQVTGRNPQADFCILPVNLASKLLGNGDNYQMLGTVTNGNLYFLATQEQPTITSENIESSLIGKTVGVVQLPNVPGLTLQAILGDHNIPYKIINGIQSEKDESAVNLLAVDAANVTPVYGCDYYLCPEPAATTKINKTNFERAGDLQQLYQAGTGYPQAVLVAKKSVIESDRAAVKQIISYMKESRSYLASVQPTTVLSLLDPVRTEGLTPSFDANNLTDEVIANCSVAFTPAEQAKQNVDLFLEKLIAVNASSASTVLEAFYYTDTQ